MQKGFNNNIEVLQDTQKTVEAPASILLTPDRKIINADSEDVTITFYFLTDLKILD